jgi:NADPH:quinone reductase-like Zn-dependent oxidoreductase
LRDKGRLRPGERVLVNGAAGGVGTFAVQIARALGAEVTAVCSTRNLEQARSLGAARVVDYTREDFARLDERYDVVLDVAGSRSGRALRRVLAPGGRIVVAGGPMAGRALGPVPHMGRVVLGGRLARRTVAVFVADINRSDLETLGDLVASGAVAPVVERTFTLDEAAEAFALLGTGHPRGKLVVTV